MVGLFLGDHNLHVLAKEYTSLGFPQDICCCCCVLFCLWVLSRESTWVDNRALLESSLDFLAHEARPNHQPVQKSTGKYNIFCKLDFFFLK